MRPALSKPARIRTQSSFYFPVYYARPKPLMRKGHCWAVHGTPAALDRGYPRPRDARVSAQHLSQILPCVTSPRVTAHAKSRAWRFKSARRTILSVASWVAASTTRGAAPASSVSCQRAAQRHQRSPGWRPRRVERANLDWLTEDVALLIGHGNPRETCCGRLLDSGRGTRYYANEWTITGPATGVTGPDSRGPRFCSIQASPRLLDSSAAS